MVDCCIGRLGGQRQWPVTNQGPPKGMGFVRLDPMARRCLGNSLRAKMKAGDRVKFGSAFSGFVAVSMATDCSKIEDGLTLSGSFY